MKLRLWKNCSLLIIGKSPQNLLPRLRPHEHHHYYHQQILPVYHTSFAKAYYIFLFVLCACVFIHFQVFFLLLNNNLIAKFKRKLKRFLKILLNLTHRFLIVLQFVQHQPVKYEIYPLSPVSRHRLNLVQRKTLVLDLDETLIHSHHDALPRNTVKPGTPHDFTVKVTIDRHPVRFFVHKRPHVDFFLDIVSVPRKSTSYLDFIQLVISCTIIVFVT